MVCSGVESNVWTKQQVCKVMNQTNSVHLCSVLDQTTVLLQKQVPIYSAHQVEDASWNKVGIFGILKESQMNVKKKVETFSRRKYCLLFMQNIHHCCNFSAGVLRAGKPVPVSELQTKSNDAVVPNPNTA